VIHKAIESVLVFVTNSLMKGLWSDHLTTLFSDEIVLTLMVQFVSTGKIYVVIFRNSLVHSDETNISQFNSFSDQLIAAPNQQDN
jgi:hypothetical protein